MTTPATQADRVAVLDDRPVEPSRWRRLRESPLLYVVALTAYPVVFLWSQNRQEPIPLRSVAVVLGVVLAITAAIWLVARLLLRDAHRASFATASIAVPFLVFGQLKTLVDPLGRDADLYLFVGFLLLMLAGVIAAVKARWVPRFAHVANPIACVLLALNIVPLLTTLQPGANSASAAGVGGPVTLPGAPPAVRPDVYYLIFDRYANQRVLSEQYGFDNAPFLNDLRDRGFTVIDDAVSNYPRTTPSLASSLSMGYLDQLAAAEGPDSHDWGAMNDLIDRSLVSRTFERLGYRTINIGSWWNSTAYDPGADENVSFFPNDEFTYVFRDTTMWPTFAHYTGISPPNGFNRDIWEATPKQFDAVAAVAADPRPTFTFGHFLVPHPPYVFRADGRPTFEYPRQPIDVAYIEQVKYANARIEELLDRIMASSQSGQEPIIVIQADEGPYPPGLVADEDHYDFFEATQPDLERKQMILNALYFPAHAGDIPEDLTPVNTFRLILSGYFGADLPMLPNHEYVLRDNQHPFEFHDVTARLTGSQT